MQAKPTTLLYHYTLIACIGITLLLGQTFKLHMHIQQDTNSVGSNAGQVLDVHIASSLHDTMPDLNHDGSHHNHHGAEVSISADGLVKNIDLQIFFSLLFFLVSTLLFRRRKVPGSRPDFIASGPAASLYLLHPPLRAPPR